MQRQLHFTDFIQEQHSEDIPHLAEHFLRSFSSPSVDHPKSFDSGALQALLRWRWPGNVRELENTVHRAFLISPRPIIRLEDLLLDEVSAVQTSGLRSDLVGMTVKDIEKALIEKSLSHVHHNRTHAAQMLGISISTLRNKLNEYQYETPDLVVPG